MCLMNHRSARGYFAHIIIDKFFFLMEDAINIPMSVSLSWSGLPFQSRKVFTNFASNDARTVDLHRECINSAMVLSSLG